MKIKLLILCLIQLHFANLGVAQDPLVLFEFTGYHNENDESYPATSINSPLIDVSEFNKAEGLGNLATAAIDRFSARLWEATVQSPSAGHYFELSITPTDQNYINLSSIEFELKRSGDGPEDFVLRSNIEDNFQTNVDGQEIAVPESHTDFSLPLDADYDGVSETLTFRFYFYNSQDKWGTIQLDDLKVYGEAIDATPPAISDPYPQATNISTSSFDLALQLNEAGQSYILVQEATLPPPTTNDVINNPTTTLDIDNATTEYTANIANLHPSTGYQAYFVLEDERGNQSGTPVLLDNIVTENLPGIAILNGATMTIDRDVTVDGPVEIDAGGKLVLAENTELTIHGDVINNGTLDDQGGTIQLSGASAQQISGHNFIHNLAISNTAGVVNEGDLSIAHTLTINENAVFDADGGGDDQTCTLLSTPEQTARIAPLGDGASVDGHITYQRFVGNGETGWKYFAIPVKNQTTDDLQDDFIIQGIDNSYPGADPQLFGYNESAGTDANDGEDGWEGIQSSSVNISSRGLRAYLYQRDVMGDPLLLDLEGAPVIGDGLDNTFQAGETYEIPLDYHADAYDGGGWNLIYNPYPSPVDWDQVFLSNDVEPAVYIWNPEVENWATYTRGSGSGTHGATRHIASGQSFFVKCNSSGQTVRIEESDKAEPGTATFIRQSAPPPQLRIQVVDNGEKYRDETIIQYSDEVHNMKMNARKLAGGMINIATTGPEGENLAIQTLDRHHHADTIPLQLIPYHFGSYRMRFDFPAPFPKRVLLQDMMDNKWIRIQDATSYTFDITRDDSSSFDRRFMLIMADPPVLSIGEDKGKRGDEIKIEVKGANMPMLRQLDMTVNWDKRKLALREVDPRAFPHHETQIDDATPGAVTVDWQSSTPKDLPDSASLMSLTFEMVSGDYADVSFEPSSIKAVRDNGLDLHPVLESGKIEVVDEKMIKGKITWPDGSAVASFNLSLSGDAHQSPATGKDATFHIPVTENEHVALSPQIHTYTNNVDLVDLVKLNSHLRLTGSLSSPVAHTAADMDRSGSIDENDLQKLKRVLIQTTTGAEELFKCAALEKHSGQVITGSTPLELTYKRKSDVHLTAFQWGDTEFAPTYPDGNRPLKLKPGAPVKSQDNGLLTIPILVAQKDILTGYRLSMNAHINNTAARHIAIDGVSPNEHISKAGIEGLNVIWVPEDGSAVTFQQGDTLFSLKIPIDRPNGELSFQLEGNSSIATDRFADPVAITFPESVFDLDNINRPQFLPNTPNPVGRQSTFSFYLPESGKVQVEICNLTGKRNVIYDGHHNTGWHKWTWNRNDAHGQRLATGIYIVRFTCEGFSKTRKVLIE